jgi:hypothetical protein
MNSNFIVDLSSGVTRCVELTESEIAGRAADEADRSRRLAAQYKGLRAAAFAAEADPLFFQEQRGEAPAGTWAAKVKEIRERFPGGEQP